MMVFNSSFSHIEADENLRDLTISIYTFAGRNVENNKFTGWIPNELKDIDNLESVCYKIFFVYSCSALKVVS